MGSDTAIDIRNMANYPNPMTGETVFTFQLTDAATVKLDVFTVSGRLVKSFPEVLMDAGYNEVPEGSTWNGNDESGDILPSGMYFWKVTAVFPPPHPISRGRKGRVS